MSGTESQDAAKTFVYVFRLDGADRFVLWQSREDDGAIRDQGRIVSRGTIGEILDEASARSLVVEQDETGVYDWDRFERWCAAPAAETIDPNDHLNAWNMLRDSVPSGTPGGRFRDAEREAGDVYDLLFHLSTGGRYREALQEYGESNEMLLDVALAGTGWHWSAAQVAELAEVLRLGIAELRRELAMA